jgi:hypothetical protein
MYRTTAAYVDVYMIVRAAFIDLAILRSARMHAAYAICRPAAAYNPLNDSLGY